MNEAQNVTEFARNISDYGFMVVVCAVFLILSMGLMVTCFKWFKSVIEKTTRQCLTSLRVLFLKHNSG